jgi:adenine/guanine phosphoribosyltransferase-like PRPP-binding protein
VALSSARRLPIISAPASSRSASRKKLPAEVESWSYDLEYGQDTLEIHKDAIGSGHDRDHRR